MVPILWAEKESFEKPSQTYIGITRSMGPSLPSMYNADWWFNPPTASHIGGSWERQIRTVRKVLASLLQDNILDNEKLHTPFHEVESIVNDRPLTPG